MHKNGFTHQALLYLPPSLIHWSTKLWMVLLVAYFFIRNKLMNYLIPIFQTVQSWKHDIPYFSSFWYQKNCFHSVYCVIIPKRINNAFQFYFSFIFVFDNEIILLYYKKQSDKPSFTCICSTEFLVCVHGVKFTST